MNKLYILLLLLSAFLCQAQNKIQFSYDSSGNQLQRELVCINCKTTNNVKNLREIRKEDLIQSEVSDQISYYPNPVQQELYLSWELVNNNSVSSIRLYSLTGHLLQSFQNKDKSNQQTILFQSYPRGVYTVVLIYSNGEQKSIKIIKQ